MSNALSDQKYLMDRHFSIYSKLNKKKEIKKMKMKNFKKEN